MATATERGEESKRASATRNELPDALGDISAEMAKDLIDYNTNPPSPVTPPPSTFGRGAGRRANIVLTGDSTTNKAGESKQSPTTPPPRSSFSTQAINGNRQSYQTAQMNPSSTNGTAFFDADVSPSKRSQRSTGPPSEPPQSLSNRDSLGKSFNEDDTGNHSGTEGTTGRISVSTFAPTAPTTKLGGFGVRDATLIPHVDGMKSKADERANRPAPSGQEPMQWGQFFWTIITDPQSSMSFFANPHTGECRWEVPAGTFVLPPDPDGQWWELFDSMRGVPYFYHTTTQRTQWERPAGLVIPMTAIQESTAGRRFSRQNFGVDTLSALAVAPSEGDSPRKSSMEAGFETPKKRGRNSYQPPPPMNSPSIEQVLAFDGSRGPLRSSQLVTDAMQSASPRAPRSRVSNLAFGEDGAGGDGRSTPTATSRFLSGSTPTIPELYDDEEEVIDAGEPSKRHQSRSMLHKGLHASLSTISSKATMTSPERRTASSSEMHITAPMQSPEQTRRNQPGRTTMSPAGQAPIRVETQSSPGSSPQIPQELKDEIAEADLSLFAAEKFSQHRTGIFRRKMPMERMLRWQKDPISSPMLALPRIYHPDAVDIFKVIQRACGDRSAPVHAIVPPPLQAPTQSMSTQEYRDMRKRLNEKSNRPPTVLEELRWVLDMGIVNSPLRDEIFVQLMKQLTENPSPECTFRGWQILCVVLSTAFPPSRDLHIYLASWISSRTDLETIGVMAEYCAGRLESIQKRGPRGKAPSLLEIQCALENPFNPGVFGITLEKVMQTQEHAYPQAKVPIILMFLTDAMLALDALKTRGIFRISGNPDQVIELRVRIERGHYSLNGLLGPDNSDVTVPASAFKLWLRELEEPLIPQGLYNQCIDAAAADSVNDCIDLVRELPFLHRRVVLFVISFLQMFCDPSALSHTQLTVDSIALIFAPNFFSLASESLHVAWRNAHWEQRFLKILLEQLDCSSLDPDYRPSHGRGPAGELPNRRRGKGAFITDLGGALQLGGGVATTVSSHSANGIAVAGDSSPEMGNHRPLPFVNSGGSGAAAWPGSGQAGFDTARPFAQLNGKQTPYATDSSADW